MIPALTAKNQRYRNLSSVRDNIEHNNNNNNNSNIINNNNHCGSEILGWYLVGDSHVSWVGRLATFLGEGKLLCKTCARKALYPWLATFLREENS